MIWYQTRADGVCNSGNAYFKTNMSHLRLAETAKRMLKHKCACSSFNLFLQTSFFLEWEGWGVDFDLIQVQGSSKGPNAEMSSLSRMTVLHQFGGWNHLVLLHTQSYKLIPVMVTLTLPSILGFCSTGTVMFPWEKWLVSTIAKACLLQAKAS